jgi:hypothetical protein
MEAVRSSEMSVNFYRSTWCCFREDTILQNKSFNTNIKSASLRQVASFFYGNGGSRRENKNHEGRTPIYRLKWHLELVTKRTTFTHCKPHVNCKMIFPVISEQFPFRSHYDNYILAMWVGARSNIQLSTTTANDFENNELCHDKVIISDDVTFDLLTCISIWPAEPLVAMYQTKFTCVLR